MPNAYQKIAEMPHLPLHLKMASAVTEYDKAQARHPGYNRYALPQYLGAAEDAAAEATENPARLRAAILGCFCGRLADAVLQACGESKRTPEESRR